MYGYNKFDKLSFDLGMIECFCEMVAAKVKTLALSPAIEPVHLQVVKGVVREIAAKYQIKYYLEDDMILNNIASEDYTKNKYVFFFYQDDAILVEYFSLKKRQQAHQTNGSYSDEIRKAITVHLCRLLSYPEERIEEKYM